MAPHTNQKVWSFYLDGRGEKLLRHDLSDAELAKEVMASDQPPRVAILAACQAVAAPLLVGKARAKWVVSNQDRLDGMDAKTAYEAWVNGRIDELAYALEADVLGEISLQFEAEEEEDDHLGDADEEDDDDDDDEDEEDDDED